MDGRASGPALGIAAGAVAVVCCAGVPAIGALVGGITIAAVIGAAAGVLALAALLSGATVLVRARRRRGPCPPRDGGPTG
jgi:hypothetical protein